MSGNTITRSIGIAFSGVLIYLAVSALPLSAADNSRCLMCHSASTIHKTDDGKKTSLHVDSKAFGKSVHGSLKCTDCHTDNKLNVLNHEPNLAVPQCVHCHLGHGPDAENTHRKVKVEDRPDCRDCHESHYMVKVKNPSSPVHPAVSQATCAKCHTDDKTLSDYHNSVHGAAKDRSGAPAAGCTDCHISHKIMSVSSAAVCEKCHKQEAWDYRAGIHSLEGKANRDDYPTCITCHGEHDIALIADPRSSVHPLNVSHQCAECHDDERMMERHGLTTASVETYWDSFHGVANKHGDTEVATCASCHDAHAALPSEDTKSATSPANLPETCGECHTGMNANIAQGKVHVDAEKKEAGLVHYVAIGFKWLTMGTIFMLVGHIILDLFSRVRRRVFRRRTEL